MLCPETRCNVKCCVQPSTVAIFCNSGLSDPAKAIGRNGKKGYKLPLYLRPTPPRQLWLSSLNHSGQWEQWWRCSLVVMLIISPCPNQPRVAFLPNSHHSLEDSSRGCSADPGCHLPGTSSCSWHRTYRERLQAHLLPFM